MTVRGFAYHCDPLRTGWFGATGDPQRLKQVADALGLDVPRPTAQQAAA
jgi:hypothetical protein